MDLRGVITPATLGVMTPTAVPASFTTHASYAGVQCSGRKADGNACRALTTGTVTVEGTEHATCKAHAAQVEAREAELATRKTAAGFAFCPRCGADLSVWDPASGPHACPTEEDRTWVLALCREFPDQCMGSGGKGGYGGPCGTHLEVVTFVDPAVLPEFIDQVRDDLRRMS
jgi:hypothetical protein